MPLQVRRGTLAQRQAMTEPLASGELLYATDTGTLYIGNGSTLGGIAVANISNQDIRDISSSLFTSGTHSGINFTYDGSVIDAVIDPDLSNYQGVIRASAFQGTLVGDDSTILVDAVSNKIELDGTVKGNIIPDVNEVYDIGSSSVRFRDLYLSGTSIDLGGAAITSPDGTTINLPLGSTVGGVPIGSGSGSGDGVIEGSTYKINIAADDSTIMVNTTNTTLRATVTFSDLIGSVFADDSTVLVDATNGVLRGNFIGSVFADDDSLLVDGTLKKIVGDIDNTTSTSVQMFSSTISLSGLDDSGAAPGVVVTSEYDETLGPTIDIRTHNNSADGQSFIAKRTRGTLASPATLQDDDTIFKFLFFGADSDASLAFASAMNIVVDGTPTSGIVPSRFEIYTSDSAGNIALGLSIDSSQTIRVANNTVSANSGTGTADVSGGVLTYLKINVAGTEYAVPLYGIVP